MANICSFAKLMNTYDICIPLIQREYAQGRDNILGSEIRRKFVPSLIRVLDGRDDSLNLDL